MLFSENKIILSAFIFGKILEENTSSPSFTNTSIEDLSTNILSSNSFISPKKTFLSLLSVCSPLLLSKTSFLLLKSNFTSVSLLLSSFALNFNPKSEFIFLNFAINS